MPPEPPAPNLARMPCLRALALASRRLEARLDQRLRPLGLTASDAWVLLLLLELAETRTTALARALALTFSTMTETADRLERAGWIERRRDPLDRRAVSLRLSPAGHRRALEVSRLLATVERLVSREVTSPEREGFRRVLEAALRTVAT